MYRNPVIALRAMRWLYWILPGERQGIESQTILGQEDDE